MTSTVAETISKRLREITQPLIHELQAIEEYITLREEEMKDLRATRTRLLAIVRQIDPELAPKKETKPKAVLAPSEKMVQSVLDWLNENMNGDEFYASGLTARKDFTVSGSQVSKALSALHERGQIALVRQGTGGSKYYRLVA